MSQGWTEIMSNCPVCNMSMDARNTVCSDKCEQKLERDAFVKRDQKLPSFDDVVSGRAESDYQLAEKAMKVKVLQRVEAKKRMLDEMRQRGLG